MLENSVLEKGIAGFVKKVTSRFPFLYEFIKRRYHGFVFLSQKLRLQRKYNGLVFIRYPQNRIKELRGSGFRSQFGQDFFLTDNNLVPNDGGVYIDIGCNHPEVGSNTFYLEKKRGFTGLAIDPVTIYHDDWLKLRPNSIHINSFISNSDDEIDFAEISGPQGWESKLSGAVDKVQLDGINTTATIRKVRPAKLKDILAENNIQFDVDVLFVDVEGHEIEVLSSADWAGKVPKVIVIENIGLWEDQERLRKFITAKGYSFSARIWVDDVFVRA